MAHAIREARFDLRLDQRAFGEKLLVSRETISAWETGETAPPLEQQRRILELFAAHPARERLAMAFDLPLPAPVAQASGVTYPKRDAASVRAGVTNAIRAAADDLDVAASSVRRTLGVVVERLREAGLTLEEAAGVVREVAGRGRK